MEGSQERQQQRQSQQQHERKGRPPPAEPDDMRSWLVAVACGWNLLWSSLFRRSTGVIYVALVGAFGATREQSSWVLSVGTSIAWLIGPLVGFLTKHVPLMALSFTGSFVTAVSAIGCAFAGDMTAVFLLLGICSGIGNGIGMSTNDVIIGKYFKRYRGSGNGIYYTGGTLAGFAFPQILHLLLQEYGFTGAFLITGGLMLNALSVCIIFKTPPWEARAKISRATASANTSSDGEQRRGSAANLERSTQVATIDGTYKAVIEAGTSANDEHNGNKSRDVRLKPSLKCTSILQSSEDFGSYVNVSLPDNQAAIVGVCTRETSDGRAPAAANSTATTRELPPCPKPIQFGRISFRFLKRKQSGGGDAPYSRLDGAYKIQDGEVGSTGNHGGAVAPPWSVSEPEVKIQYSEVGSTGNNSGVAPPWSVSEPEVMIANGCPEAVAVDAAVKGLCRQTSVRQDALEASGNAGGSSYWSFLRAPVFYMVAVTCAFSVYTLLVLMILVDFAIEKGFTRRDGAVFLSVSAIGDACARLVAGALSDRAFCDRRVLISASAMLTGALCVAMPSMRPDRYAVAVLMCALLGSTNGTVAVLFVPVLADQLGVENLGLSSGITRFGMGLAYMACPKITGYYKDEIGSYDGLLHMISIGSFLVCVMWTTDFIYRHLKRCRTNSAS
ncbi:uncharacterized protein [Dermacentor andersoni]|uniref:uncharacterized protein n=1 Tax=Dermacentor andersoni TaxID=34620 RepID=UPI002417FFCF|nr:uncharacterized protein LOC129387480 [Dermacentor andersoni]XP_054932379.1 uncharacterized protein LOC129387480 [Dermacentor andersoni]XP_054932381.1 uncharacterized protein LOC129387480 [Dermacentor andersoni]XP_054932383.1 uncharacterized protein LOC129387480 [Dermacentor andersoni]